MGDKLISLQSVLDIISDSIYDLEYNDENEELQNKIKSLPSVNQVLYENRTNLCDTCKYDFPDCQVSEKNRLFSEGDGYEDNICACRIYKYKGAKWIPCSERMPTHSYTRSFWLTVLTDDNRYETLIGRWSSWSGNENKSYDAFDCWKDVLINGHIYRLSQPIPKEKVIAWMPLPIPYREQEKEQKYE